MPQNPVFYASQNPQKEKVQYGPRVRTWVGTRISISELCLAMSYCSIFSVRNRLFTKGDSIQSTPPKQNTSGSNAFSFDVSDTAGPKPQVLDLSILRIK